MFFGHVFDQAVERDAGIAEQYVEPTVGFYGRVHCPLRVGHLRHVRPDERRLRQAGCQRLAFLRINIRNHHRRALGCKGLDRSPADAVGPAGDQHNPVLETHRISHHTISLYQYP